MEPENPLLSWKRPAMETHSDPSEFNPHHHTILLQDPSYHDPPIRLRLRSGSYSQLLRPKYFAFFKSPMRASCFIKLILFNWTILIIIFLDLGRKVLSSLQQIISIFMLLLFHTQKFLSQHCSQTLSIYVFPFTKWCTHIKKR